MDEIKPQVISVFELIHDHENGAYCKKCGHGIGNKTI